MSDLIGNPEDRFSHNEAHMQFQAATLSAINGVSLPEKHTHNII